ncbi:MAG: response regulator [Desulfosalsimonadaceae bacterium]
MLPQVLLVDDDRSWLKMMEKELANYAGSFRVKSTNSAENALAMLAREHFMLVVSDLRMSGMDGFELLSRILEKYPDVPVIIVTAHDRPKTKEVVFRSGAAGYMVKPFPADKMSREISKMLSKKAEGGNLHNVSLETFLQLVEMEQQTCTLHVLNKTRGSGGVLFFRDGELVNARICDRMGTAAAYEILSWSGVSVFIENNCVFEEKQIDGDLQAILLDAMRSKDENDDFAFEDKEQTTREAAEGQEKEVEEQAGYDKGSRQQQDDAEDPADSEVIRRRLDASLGNYRGVEDVYTDSAWNPLLSAVSDTGNKLGLGQLNVVYASRAQKQQYLVLPGEVPTVIAVTADASRDKIMGALS